MRPSSPARVCQICVQPPCRWFHPRCSWSFLQWYSLLIADSIFPIFRISYFVFFHFLQYNYHIIFFWRELYQSHNLPDLLDWSFSRSLYWFSLFSILQCLGGRKLPQYCVVCHLKDWTHPGSKNWIGLSSRFHRHNSKTGHNFKHNLQC